MTVTVNTTQMNVTEHAGIDDFKGVSRGFPHLYATYKDMIVPSNPSWAEEHIRRLTAAGIQSEFQCYNINSFETIERMIRRGVYKGPLVMNWVAISGGMDQANIATAERVAAGGLLRHGRGGFEPRLRSPAAGRTAREVGLVTRT